MWYSYTSREPTGPMPRPPVPPEQRQRVSKACDICKASKRRCDARLPCSACVKRNATDACSYSQPGRQKRPADSNHTSTEASGRSTSHASDLLSAARMTSPVSTADDKAQDDRASVGVPVLTRNRVVFNTKRERGKQEDACPISSLIESRSLCRRCGISICPPVPARRSRSALGPMHLH